MSIVADTKYLHLISGNLPLFKRKGENLYNFRCPFCGDSRKNDLRARGYVYKKEDTLRFKCHNCDLTANMYYLIKQLQPSLLGKYILETKYDKEFFEFEVKKFRTKAKPTIKIDQPFKDLIPVFDLPYDHPAKVYLDNRLIPGKDQLKLYYAEKYFEWVNSLIPGKFKDKALFYDCPRIVIPFYGADKVCFGFQGRLIHPEAQGQIRYVSIILDDNYKKIYGLDTIDISKPVRVVEGPFDSFFVKNCLAFAGSDGKLSDICPKENITIIYDNQPRNEQIVKKVQSSITAGYNVLIWPSHIEYKDINDMIVKGGLKVNDIEEIIKHHTHRELIATIELNKWKKI